MPDIGLILDLLERHEALELSGSHSDNDMLWPEISQGETILEVDYGRLFPRARPSDRGAQDWDLYGDEWQIGQGDAAGVIEGGADGPSAARPPEWDVWAWYQPIHFGGEWGIFIREAGLIECARRIAASLSGRHGPTHDSNLAKALVRSAFATLFLHEQYHHKTESLALRLHVVERRPVYPAYHRRVYRPAAGTKDQIEEGLANADSWRRITGPTYQRWTGRTVSAIARAYLEQSFYIAPPGYANAGRLLSGDAFDREQEMLFASVQEGVLPPARAPTSEFGIATHLNHTLFTVTQRIWTIVPAAARSILPTHPSIAPLATNRLERFIRRQGWSAVSGGGKGSNRKFRDAKGRMIILPDAKDVSMPVLRTAADTLGVSMHQLETIAR
jgi:hypothetical protein